ncbi:hypothetical protein [Hahella ganghwensis]|uniref:hypothetical protein n=1 Tax=Hahella ganghwensis TaxID=286420 RepID=UPI00036ABD25|nr:hypothetical protein [Hahella ganghwensis]
MYKHKMEFKFLALAALFASNATMAAECFQPSPYLQKEGDAYYEFDQTHEWEAKQQKFVDVHYKELPGDWKGSLTEYDCFGTDNNPRKKIKEAKVDVSLSEGANNMLRIDVKKEFKVERTIRSETYHAFDSRYMYGGEATEALLEGSDRFRRKNANSGSRLVEYVHTFTRSGDSLTLTQHMYVNGHLAREESYQLKRD